MRFCVVMRGRARVRGRERGRKPNHLAVAVRFGFSLPLRKERGPMDLRADKRVKKSEAACK